LGGNEGVEDFADYLRVGLPPHKWLNIVLLDFPVLVLHRYALSDKACIIGRGGGNQWHACMGHFM
jgi:hypothetical protein